MAYTKSNRVFGLHAATLVDIATGLPLAEPILLSQGSTLTVTREDIDIRAADNAFAIDSADGEGTAEISMTIDEMNSGAIQALIGTPVTRGTAGTTGAVTTLTDRNGTSVVSATVGIASVGIKVGSSPKYFGQFVVKAVSATTVDVYAMSDFGGLKIADALTGKVNTTPLTITTATATDIVDADGVHIGLTLTGGSGTIAMTIGDTATFQSIPPYVSEFSFDIRGDQGKKYYSMIFTASDSQARSCEVFVGKIKLGTLPIAFTPREWFSAEITGKAYPDCSGKIAQVTYVNFSDNC